MGEVYFDILARDHFGILAGVYFDILARVRPSLFRSGRHVTVGRCSRVCGAAGHLPRASSAPRSFARPCATSAVCLQLTPPTLLLAVDDVASAAALRARS